MLTWIAMIGCGTGAPQTPAPALSSVEESAPEGPARTKHKHGKGGQKAGKRPTSAKACAAGEVKHAGWSGEYPSPVIDVTAPVTLEGHTTPCQREASEACTVPPGLYHPWSKTGASFATVRGIERYAATADTEVGDVPVAAGSEIAVTQYLSEGFCVVEVAGKPIEAMCPGLDDASPFERIAGPEVPVRQFVRIRCQEGAQVWIEAAVLMKQPGVREGETLGFGEVGPGK